MRLADRRRTYISNDRRPSRTNDAPPASGGRATPSPRPDPRAVTREIACPRDQASALVRIGSSRHRGHHRRYGDAFMVGVLGGTSLRTKGAIRATISDKHHSAGAASLPRRVPPVKAQTRRAGILLVCSLSPAGSSKSSYPCPTRQKGADSRKRPGRRMFSDFIRASRVRFRPFAAWIAHPSAPESPIFRVVPTRTFHGLQLLSEDLASIVSLDSHIAYSALSEVRAIQAGR